jgi:hypothetical protein
MGITTTAATMANLLPNSVRNRVNSDPIIVFSGQGGKHSDNESLSKEIRKNKANATDLNNRVHVNVPPKCIGKGGGHVHFDASAAAKSAARILGVSKLNHERLDAHLKSYLLDFQYAEEGDPWFGYASDTQRYLLENVSVARLNKLIKSLEFYGGPEDSKSQRRAFCERYVYDMTGQRPEPGSNKKIIGCSTSYFRGDAKVDGNLEPLHQLAWFMKTLVKRKGHSAVEANVLTVVAPALDDSKQPGYGQYVFGAGALNKKPYKLAMETIANQIFECSMKHDHLSNVALSAVGMGAFLSSLRSGPRGNAQKVGIKVYADLVLRLRKEGRTPVFQGKPNDEFWAKVNAKLEDLGQKAIKGLGLVPDCVTGDAAKRTLWVNAGDASSLTGNRCNKDQSLDGYWGRSSLLHLQHLVLAAVHNSRREIPDTDSHSNSEPVKQKGRTRPTSLPLFRRQ